MKYQLHKYSNNEIRNPTIKQMSIPLCDTIPYPTMCDRHEKLADILNIFLPLRQSQSSPIEDPRLTGWKYGASGFHR